MARLLGRRASPYEWELSNFGDIFHHVIRLFFRPHWLLRLELAMEQADCVHSQFPAGADFARGPVAHDENLAGHQPGLAHDFAEG